MSFDRAKQCPGSGQRAVPIEGRVYLACPVCGRGAAYSKAAQKVAPHYPLSYFDRPASPLTPTTGKDTEK